MAGITALVTGATGFAGSQLCRALLDAGYRVRALHGASSRLRLLDELDVMLIPIDLSRPDGLREALEGVEIIFHAEDWSGGNDPVRMRSAAVDGTRNLLQAAGEVGVQRVVHTSSVAALGAPDILPHHQAPIRMNEHHTWNLRPGIYPYGYACYLAEREVQTVVARGLDVVIVNPSLVFGPGDLYGQANSLITRVAERRLTLAPEGGINCVHIADVVAGHLAALQRGKTGERYILGGENLTYAEILAQIARVAGVPEPGTVVPGWLLRALAGPASLLHPFLDLPVAPQSLQLAGLHFYYDTDKAERELGLARPRPAIDAFRDAYQWFRQASTADLAHHPV